MSDRYGLLVTEHRRDVPWDQARRPRRWHRCRPWTVEVYDDGTRREFCRCGAARVTGQGWAGRDSR